MGVLKWARLTEGDIERTQRTLIELALASATDISVTKETNLAKRDALFVIISVL